MCFQLGGERHELDHVHDMSPDRLASSSSMQGVEQNAVPVTCGRRRTMSTSEPCAGRKCG